MPPKNLRVHQLAKELGVNSKVIVAKCEAEGVPGITNHMSVVKLGLAATVREWFSGDDADADHNAVETAEKVDLEKVRKPAKRKAAKKKPAEEKAADTEATAEAAEEKPKPKPKRKRKPVEPVVELASAATDAQAEAPADQAAEPAPEIAATPDTPAPAVPEMPKGPAGVQNVPDRPDIIKPVGEQLDAPKKAKLSGPKVIRVEKPEPDASPRPRRTPGGGGGGPRGGRDGGGGGGMGGNVEGISRSRGPVRGGGVRGGGGGGGGEERGNKRRGGMNSRRGRSADALLTGPTQLSKADADELDARLKGSTGYMKQRRRDLRNKGGGATGFQTQTAVQTGGKVEIEEPITIKGLSAATGIKTAQIIKFLFKQGVMATVNSAIGTEAAMEAAMEYDIELEVKELETAEEKVEKQFAAREKVDEQSRPPVVTVLGHVDHGKTSLLDRIRQADVADHEDGGITQHVGAYRVSIEGQDGEKKSVVFLDTPGHEAFSTMRARGAKMTDLVVLVVAADDGVMPTTIEAIAHAKAAEVPIIVAMNKIDTPQATDENIRKIYGQLAEHGLNPTEWGGETEIVKTSATEGTGITELLEILDYQAELLELTADYGGPARGTVIEAEMQTGRGSVARVLVQDGQVKVGDFIVSGRAFGRVRDMINDREQSVTDAGPATPLELSGIDLVPDAGDKFFVTDSLKRAEEVELQYRETERQQTLASKTKVTLDNFADAVAAGNIKDLRVVIKADVQGSIETLTSSLEKMGNDEVTVKVLHAAVGGITEGDVLLADASDAIILGFHVTATPAVREIADERKVDIRMYRVIYDLTDDVKKGLEGMLTPDRNEEEIGQAEVKEVFRIGGVGAIAGCLITEGSAQKTDVKVRVSRDGVVITDDRDVESLRRVKDEVKEVRAGTECGVRVANFDDLKAGDTLIFYKVIEVQRTLD
ncbi:MAG: translation initiation factor IF-2 [Planctomycetota bacterium]